MNKPGFFAWETALLKFEFIDDEGEPATDFLSNLQECIVTIRQGSSAVVEKTGSDVSVDVENASVMIELSQKDTSKFSGGTRENPKIANAQVNVRRTNSERDVTYEADLVVWRNLHGKEMK